jgi:hypothetical protein
MKPVILNILAVIAGFLGGSLINMGLIQTGHSLFPIKGVNPEDMEALAAAIPTLEFKYFIFPFLAHALGTLAGAFIAGFIAESHKMKFALGVGVLFLLGGIMASFMLPAPVWFIGTDLALAYIPMAWIGGRAALKVTAKK